MNAMRDDLIRELVSDLQPVKPPPNPVVVATLWWVLAWAVITIVAVLVAPMRPGALAQLVSTPRFLGESIFGLGAGWFAAVTALNSSVPGAGSARRTWIALGLILIWVAVYAVGLESPSLAPSMIGKRAECFMETFLYTIPMALIGRWLCHRYFVLAPIGTMVLMTLAAALIPSLLMQFACMYIPEHILTHHILPIPFTLAAMAGVEWGLRKFRT